mmetsp:Transcript_57799/g.179394  ORF Transcript_57799/g.179394 Transcript_57799/m.179394 type:complete len:272 (-) Transcript_57799:109-924(-)
MWRACTRRLPPSQSAGAARRAAARRCRQRRGRSAHAAAAAAATGAVAEDILTAPHGACGAEPDRPAAVGLTSVLCRGAGRRESGCRCFDARHVQRLRGWQGCPGRKPPQPAGGWHRHSLAQCRRQQHRAWQRRQQHCTGTVSRIPPSWWADPGVPIDLHVTPHVCKGWLLLGAHLPAPAPAAAGRYSVAPRCAADRGPPHPSHGTTGAGAAGAEWAHGWPDPALREGRFGHGDAEESRAPTHTGRQGGRNGSHLGQFHGVAGVFGDACVPS